VPAGWTSWGGVVGTLLLGVNRCLDCRAERLRSGRPPGLGAIAVLVGRGVILLVGAFVAVLALHALLGGAT
jgi:hypothetical protein